ARNPSRGWADAGSVQTEGEGKGMKPTWQTDDGSVQLYLGDCLEILPHLGPVDAVVTDPVWPNNSIPEFAGIDAVALCNEVCRHIGRLAKRAAFQLGCHSDPRGMFDDLDMPLFRVSWLRYARPHYMGRLLYGSDVAYQFGEPPASRPGGHVVPGEVCKTDSNGRVTDHACERALQHVHWLVEKWTSEGESV